MRYLKVIMFLLFLSVSSLSANTKITAYLDKKNCCIDDYYTQNGKFYYLKSRTGQWNSTSYSNYSYTIIPYYIYDDSDDTCRPIISKVTGIDGYVYMSLMALAGLLFGFIILYFSISLFMKIGIGTRG